MSCSKFSGSFRAETNKYTFMLHVQLLLGRLNVVLSKPTATRLSVLDRACTCINKPVLILCILNLHGGSDVAVCFPVCVPRLTSVCRTTAASHRQDMSSTPPSGIYTPGSIWAKAIEQYKAQKQQDLRDDAYLFFLGAKSSGKTTLLNRFLYPNQIEVPKPSQCLEYTFARKAAAAFGIAEKKSLAHIWEVAGSDAFAHQLAQGNQIFLTYRQVTTAVVVIVLDLSQLNTVIPAAVQYLDLVKRKLATTYTLFERKGLQLPEQLRTRQRAKLFNQHEDKDLISCSGISIVLVATKWDAFRDRVEAEGQRVLARCLRWLAHAHGAHLLYLGGLGTTPSAVSAAAAPAGSQQLHPQQLLDNFMRLLNHVTFLGMDRKMPLKLPPQFDHLAPLMIPAGSDKFASIGSPQSQLAPGTLKSANDVSAVQQQWIAAAESLFPSAAIKPQQQQQLAGLKIGTEVDARYREEDVDCARARREAALEAYRREMEAVRREELAARKQKAAAAAGGQPAAPGRQQQQQSGPLAASGSRRCR